MDSDINIGIDHLTVVPRNIIETEEKDSEQNKEESQE